VRAVFFAARQVFQHAVLQEVIPGNPIVVAKGVLPRVQDKDPTWRAQAVFTEAEVEQLISNPKIAPHRRMAYALEFLTGLRTGQVSALRWGDYEPELEPLGRIVSSLSWDSKRKLVKATKTSVTHEVPVHPTLAKVLARWKLSGWRTRMKRGPKQDDLIIPTIRGGHRDVRKALEDFHEDLQRPGLRKRRHYDARRTFISLGLDGGASKDILQNITHPRPADAFDLYRTPAWAARCEAVKKLGVELREGTVGQLPTTSGTSAFGDSLETPAEASSETQLTAGTR
jgi:integrase